MDFFKKMVSAAAVLGCAAVSAQGVSGPLPAEPQFLIQRYEVKGNTLLPDDLIEQAVGHHVGPRSTFETIQSALEELEKAYLDLGYGSVRVVVPEQEVNDGVIQLQVIEAKLDAVVVEGAQHHSADNVRRAFPALQPGDAVNMYELRRDVRLANQNAYKQSDVVFRRSSKPAMVDAVVKVTDTPTTRWAATLDNTGSATTGRTRAALLYQNGNLWDLDHTLAVQTVLSPEKMSDLAVLGLSYHIPLYGWGDSLDFTAAYSNVDSGVINGMALSGSGNVYGVRYNQLMAAPAGQEHTISYTFDFKRYRNSAVDAINGGSSVMPDLVVTPLGVGYSVSSQQSERDWLASATLVHNIPSHRLGTTAQFNSSDARQRSKASFTALRLNAGWTERFENQSSVKLTFNSQWTRDLLIGAEQFGIGGADSVRGYAERDAGGDKGLRTSLEWVAPDVGGSTGVPQLRLNPVVFTDAGKVWNNDPTPGESAVSWGVGLRGAWGRELSFKLDWARTLRATVATPKGQDKLHFQALWFF